MRLIYCLFVLFMLSFLTAGCRSSRSGASHSEINAQYLRETRNDSVDFRERFARKLSEQEARLRGQVIEFYPPLPGDTAERGPIKSITDFDFSSTDISDSVVVDRHIACSSDTTSERLMGNKKEYGVYQIKPLPWYQPFIPYLVLAFIAVIIYYFRKR